MKTQKLVALVGTMALALNIVLPGLAFGADQGGSQDITGDNDLIFVTYSEGDSDFVLGKTAPVNIIFDYGLVASPTEHESYGDCLDTWNEASSDYVGKTGIVADGYCTGNDTNYQFSGDYSNRTAITTLPEQSFLGVEYKDPGTSCGFDVSSYHNGFVSSSGAGATITGLNVATTKSIDLGNSLSSFTNSGTGYITDTSASLGESVVVTLAGNVPILSGNDSITASSNFTELSSNSSSPTDIMKFDSAGTPGAIPAGTYGLGMMYNLTIPAGQISDTYAGTITYSLLDDLSCET